MRSKLILFAFALTASTAAIGQDVQKCCGTSNSTFLLGNTSYARHTQSLYLPSDLVGAENGSIDRLYFRYGSTGEDLGNTLTGLVIRLGQTADIEFPGGNTFFTGLETVLEASAYTIAPGVEEDWFVIMLDQLFDYDASKTLILDIWFEGSQTVNFGTLGTNNDGRKLYAIDLELTTGTASSSTWQDIGFDLADPNAVPATTRAEFRAVPLPGGEQWRVDVGDEDTDARTMEVLDAQGRLLSTQVLQAGQRTALIDLAGQAAGVYLVQLQLRDGSRRTERLVKP